MTRYPDCAVLLVGHGSSRRPSAAASLERHANALRAAKVFGEVHAALLIGGSSTPAEVFHALTRSTAVVVPMMMCAGWTTRQVVPQALGLAALGRREATRRIIVCDPIGLHRDFSRLVADRVTDRAAVIGVPATSVTLLLIAHGSTRNAASHDATELQAGRIRATGGFRAVTTAYLEQPPRLADVLPTLVRPVIAVGCFAAPGHHAAVDVATAVSGQPDCGVTDLGPIGDDKAVPQLIQRMIEDQLAGGPCPG